MGNHVESVARIYDAFGRGDVASILESLAEDVAWERWENNYGQRAGVPWLARLDGRTAVPQFFEIIGKWEFKAFEVRSLMSDAHQVAAEIVVHVRFPGSGVELREEEIHLWTFNEAGKVSRFRHYADTAKHIEAARQGHS